MPQEIRSLDVREVSLVGRPANRRRFAIVKADEGRTNMGLLEDVKEGIAGIREAVSLGEVEDAQEALNTLEHLLEEHLGEDAEKARRRREDEDDADGSGTPARTRTARSKTERLIETMVGARIEKAAGGPRPLTKAQAFAEVLRENPGLYEDYHREQRALARR
jgi:hypothetical protein